MTVEMLEEIFAEMDVEMIVEVFGGDDCGDVW